MKQRVSYRILDTNIQPLKHVRSIERKIRNQIVKISPGPSLKLQYLFPNSSCILSYSKFMLVWRKPQPEVIIKFKILRTKIRWVNTKMFKVSEDGPNREVELQIGETKSKISFSPSNNASWQKDIQSRSKRRERVHTASQHIVSTPYWTAQSTYQASWPPLG